MLRQVIVLASILACSRTILAQTPATTRPIRTLNYRFVELGRTARIETNWYPAMQINGAGWVLWREQIDDSKSAVRLWIPADATGSRGTTVALDRFQSAITLNGVGQVVGTGQRRPLLWQPDPTNPQAGTYIELTDADLPAEKSITLTGISDDGWIVGSGASYLPVFARVDKNGKVLEPIRPIPMQHPKAMVPHFVCVRDGGEAFCMPNGWLHRSLLADDAKRLLQRCRHEADGETLVGNGKLWLMDLSATGLILGTSGNRGVLSRPSKGDPLTREVSVFVGFQGANGSSRTYGMNEHGICVGASMGRAALWSTPEQVVDLNECLRGEDAKRCKLLEAAAINDNGWIVGIAERTGRPPNARVAFALIPTAP